MGFTTISIHRDPLRDKGSKHQSIDRHETYIDVKSGVKAKKDERYPSTYRSAMGFKVISIHREPLCDKGSKYQPIDRP